ncbi:hypothetical protein PAXRUDRAFT_832162 [Paxillus rubicundulus Ve08.2h10]|uniref:Kri1-like C-terminal domain-containing protein n=1 Tax=Paxillus rubicundulus Ve08.2h10 TaxID=930991 RepID=A0A0D0CIW5_9AGAM|nr:hypothetical protein PAXRUDRAFT_832162 [Paxillus rubicundulus Ve08.2h10]
MLSDSDSEANDFHTLTINEHFAKAFQYKKEREELAKLKEKYGSDYSESGSSGSDDSEDSEDTEEDSDGQELTPAVDAAILRTLARIRKKDPAIYEGGRNVFEEEHLQIYERAPVIKTKTKDKSKPLTIREAALASALAETASRSPSPEPRLTHAEEQCLLKSEVRTAFHGTVDVQTEGDDDGDDLFIPRSRTRDEIELEEKDYKAFLEREVGEDLRDLVAVNADAGAGGLGEGQDATKSGEGDKLERSKKKKKGKKEREIEMEDMKEREEGKSKQVKKKDNQKSKEEADQEFLLQYILNRGWMDRSARRVPTYNEITNSSPPKSSKRKSNHPQSNPDGSGEESEDARQGAEGGGQAVTLSDEEAFDDLADAFETSYNFRFEEPSAARIPSYPRNLPSARRESTTRKDARERKKDRKEAETRALLEARREEVRRERALIEAAVAEEDEGDAATEYVLGINGDGSGKKKSTKPQKKEELARLKALKGQELRRKLEMVSAEGGLGRIDEEALAHLDLDADWDPSKHDIQMAKLYEDYNIDIVDDDDIEKPTWEDDINIDDIVPPVEVKSKAQLKKDKKKDKKRRDDRDDQDEDLGVDADEMDADVDGGWNERDNGEEWEGTEEERKRKVDAYMDEVVNRLGFSGISSHMPTRFHYTSASPDNYGLTPTEILLATDADLNSYVGLKKLAPYRVDRGGKTKKDWDPMRIQRLKEFREKLRTSVGAKHGAAWSLGAGGGFNNRATEVLGEKKKRKGKKERAKSRATAADNVGEGSKREDDRRDENDTHVPSTNAEDSSHTKRKRDSHFGSDHPDNSPDHTEGVGASRNGGAENGAPKKKRRRRHKSGSGGTTEVAPP